MTNSHFVTYLNDHRAGARFAIELLERLSDFDSDPSLAEFAAELLPQIEEDYAVLNRIAVAQNTDANIVKEFAGWIAEKLSRAKLRLNQDPSIGAFESLEMLSLGILGKLKLWEVLQMLGNEVKCLEGIDFVQLLTRAQHQHDLVEGKRKSLARRTFVTGVCPNGEADA